MTRFVLPPAAASYPLPLTLGQWFALGIEVRMLPTLAAKVDALFGADEKVLWLRPYEAAVVREVLDGPRWGHGRRHAGRCRAVARKLRQESDRLDRPPRLGEVEQRPTEPGEMYTTTQSTRPASTSAISRRRPGRSVSPPVNPLSAYRSGRTVHPSSLWVSANSSPASASVRAMNYGAIPSEGFRM